MGTRMKLGERGFMEAEEAGIDSYSNGGTTVDTALGRVDNVDAVVDNVGYYIKVDKTGGNASQFTFQLFNESDDTEVGDGTDISGDTITYQAYRT